MGFYSNLIEELRKGFPKYRMMLMIQENMDDELWMSNKHQDISTSIVKINMNGITCLGILAKVELAIYEYENREEFEEEQAPKLADSVYSEMASEDTFGITNTIGLKTLHSDWITDRSKILGIEDTSGIANIMDPDGKPNNYISELIKERGLAKLEQNLKTFREFAKDLQDEFEDMRCRVQYKGGSRIELHVAQGVWEYPPYILQTEWDDSLAQKGYVNFRTQVNAQIGYHTRQKEAKCCIEKNEDMNTPDLKAISKDEGNRYRILFPPTNFPEETPAHRIGIRAEPPESKLGKKFELRGGRENEWFEIEKLNEDGSYSGTQNMHGFTSKCSYFLAALGKEIIK